jgi:hypothetical protein
MKPYIITRFSILDESAYDLGLWEITKTNPDRNVLKKRLFDKNRLDEKLNAFKNVTYPSIVGQTNKNFIWRIFTSKYLPKKYKNELYNLETNNIKIIEVKTIAEFMNILDTYEYETDYATVRLDDDDGLNVHYVDRLNKIYEKSEGHEVVSFPVGRKYTYHEGKFLVENQWLTRPKIALGLAKFNGNIHSFMNHTLIDKENKMIYDNTKNMYLVYASRVCDTKRKFNFGDCSELNIKSFLMPKFWQYKNLHILMI